MIFLVTGASRGLGLGLVKMLISSSRHMIIATCRNPSTAQELSALSSQYGERLLTLPLDVVSTSSYDAVKVQLQERGINSIDVLWANAGVASSNPNPTPASVSVADMMDVFNTNCVGTLLTVQAFADLLCAGNGRLLVTVSSLMGSIQASAGARGSANALPYRASKAALNMLTATCVQDPQLRAAGCKAICMHPGWVQTDMGSSGGRTAPVTVDQSVAGMLNVVRAALGEQKATEAGGGSFNISLDENLLRNAADLSPFLQKFREDNCVFVDYSAKLVAW